MTIADLYNALEKAIDSGKATLETTVLTKKYKGNAPYNEVNETAIDEDGDFIIS